MKADIEGNHRAHFPFVHLAVAILLLIPIASPLLAQGSSQGEGTVPVLVKSRVALTSEIVAMISEHASRVTYVWPEIDAMALTVTPSKMAALVADPVVALVEPDQRAQALADDEEMPGDLTSPPATVVPIFANGSAVDSWNIDMVDTTGTGYDGSGVTVAVLDSGLPQNWSEFLPPGSVDTTYAAGFGSEGFGDFHNPVNAIRGVGGHIGLFPHGLAVSSVIVGFPSDYGPILGAAPGATIVPIRVLNQFNFGWSSWFTAAFLYVARLVNEGAIDGPVVISYSIQGRNTSLIVRDAIDYALLSGIKFVTIAGNFGTDGVSFPGRLPQSITVGSVGWTGTFSSPLWFLADVPDNPVDLVPQIFVSGFSGRELFVPPATQIDVMAPGDWVFGEWLFGNGVSVSGSGFSEGRSMGFDGMSNFIFGTSFACPHVTGIVAQMLQKNPGLTQSQVETILRKTALDIPSPGAGGPFWPPWGSDATGEGLARGAAALAETPAP